MDPYRNYPLDFDNYKTFLNILSNTDPLNLYQQLYLPLQESRRTIKDFSDKLDQANYQLARLNTDIYISPDKFAWKMNLQSNFRRRFLYWLPRGITQQINTILVTDLYSDLCNWQQYIIHLKNTHLYTYGQLRFSQFWGPPKPLHHYPILLRSLSPKVTSQITFN